MARIIDDRTSFDLTVKIFDDFYSFNMIVNGNEFDINISISQYKYISCE